MITVEKLKDILKKRTIYDINTMVTYSRGRLNFVLCPINNKVPFSDVFVITHKLQNAKWERVRTIQNMLNWARIHHTILLRICVFNNSRGGLTALQMEMTIFYLSVKIFKMKAP